MANSYDFIGDDKNYFMKSSLSVYTDLSGTMQYVGKTSNEKALSPNTELAEWFDNTGGVQTLFVLDIDKFEFNMQFSFMQVFDPNVIAAAWNLDLDNSDPNTVYQFAGSNPNALQEAEWRFVGRSISGLIITLVLRKAIIVPNGDWANGAPGEFTNIPVTARALQDTNITDTKRDLAYFMIDKQAAS
jgi:hypothetical protein